MPSSGAAARYIDISIPLRTGMVTWPGDPALTVTRVADLAAGDAATVSALALGAHAGTHIDTPMHFIPGSADAGAFDLEAFIGPCVVAHAPAEAGVIDAATLDRLEIPSDAERVLLKTGNSALWERQAFAADFVGVAEDGARWFVERGVRLVGIDYLSIAPYGQPTPTHRILLKAGIVILEGTDLRAVEPGRYELICLPLQLLNTDGVPARAVLRPPAVDPG